MPALWNPSSLRFRLIAAMVGVALLAMASFAVVAYWQQRSVGIESSRAEMRALARLLGNRSAAALAFGDAQLAQENVDALGELPQVAQGCLYGSDTGLLASYRRNNLAPRCPLSRPEAGVEGLRLVEPIQADGSVVGWMLIEFNLDQLTALERRQLQIVVLALGIAVLPALILALVLQRRIVRPIGEVRAVAEAVVLNRDFSRRAPVPREDELGSLARAFNTMLDTLSVQAKRLASESSYNALLFRDSPIPIVVADPRTATIIDCNDAAVAAYGRASRHEVVGLSPGDVSAPRQYDGRLSDEHMGEIYGSVQEGGRRFEWLHKRPDGSTWDAEVHMRWFDIEGRPHALLSLIDVTERRFAQAQMARMNLELEARVEARTSELQQTLSTLQLAQDELVRSERLASLGSLVAGVAHELNTPLGNMLMVASTFADEVGPVLTGLREGQLKRSALEHFLGEAEQMSALLLRNGERAAELIRQFKQVAVDQTSEMRRRYDFGQTLGEVLRTLQPQFRNSAHKVVLESTEHLEMDGYPGAISQIVTNLVLNTQVHAFLPEQAGTVQVLAKADGPDHVVLEIVDDGKGIPADTLPRIFDPFFTTKFGQGGSGLGLHIVWVLVTDRLGGQIKVYSEVGTGTRFWMRLPRLAPQPAAKASAEGPPTA